MDASYCCSYSEKKMNSAWLCENFSPCLACLRPPFNPLSIKIWAWKKKSACWVPKLLPTDQKQERVKRSDEIFQLLWLLSLAVQHSHPRWSAVSFSTLETKRKSIQWVEGGRPGPIKARVNASRMKQVVLLFFDTKVIICRMTSPRANRQCSVHRDSSGKKVSRGKRPIL